MTRDGLTNGRVPRTIHPSIYSFIQHAHICISIHSSIRPSQFSSNRLPRRQKEHLHTHTHTHTHAFVGLELPRHEDDKASGTQTPHSAGRSATVTHQLHPPTEREQACMSDVSVRRSSPQGHTDELKPVQKVRPLPWAHSCLTRWPSR